MISIIVSFSISVALQVVDNMRRASDSLRSKEAFLMAESAMELALLENSKLKKAGNHIGVNKTDVIDLSTYTGLKMNKDSQNDSFSARYTIDGTSKEFPVQTVESKFIIPLPFTGNAPWNGEGSQPGGGCDPYRIPYSVDATTKDATDAFVYGHDIKGTDETGQPTEPPTEPSLLNHPCNWNIIKVGEKVSISLYGAGTAQGDPQNITDFILKVRTPCAPTTGPAPQYCAAGQRWILNCFDRGSEGEGVRCTEDEKPSNASKKGEIILTWQIDGEKEGKLISLLPNTNEIMNSDQGYPNDSSQIYEGLINKMLTTQPSFEIFNSQRPPSILGLSTASTNRTETTQLQEFLNEVEKPVFKFSAISGLVGCQENTNNLSRCNPSTTANLTPLPNIPYLEYQLVFPSGSLTPPANTANIITVTGRSGAFTHTMQVKVPHESGQLEFVLQQ